VSSDSGGDAVAIARLPFHVMTKPTGAVCTLGCEHCFFLSKEQLQPGSTFRMSPEVHEVHLTQLFAAHGPTDEVVVAYQGGEPTLTGRSFFALSVELAARLRGPDQRVLHTIQTNGTLLDDYWGAFPAGPVGSPERSRRSTPPTPGGSSVVTTAAWSTSTTRTGPRTPSPAPSTRWCSTSGHSRWTPRWISTGRAARPGWPTAPPAEGQTRSASRRHGAPVR
jgi:hypothetical protein